MELQFLEGDRSGRSTTNDPSGLMKWDGTFHLIDHKAKRKILNCML